MKCIDAEKYLPLYVRSDLAIGRGSRITEHLQNCNHCRGLVDEYKDAQQWLRSYEPPEFRGDFFDGIRQNVLSEINRTNRPAGLLHLINDFIYEKSGVAASVALLIILSAVALYVTRTPRMGLDLPDRATVADGSNRTPRIEENPADPNRSHAPVRLLPTVKRLQLSSKDRGRMRLLSLIPSDRVPRPLTAQTVRPDSKEEQISERGLNQAPVKAGAEAETSPITTESSALASVTPRETLRVEMQTKDPSVRIIWFVPPGSIIK